MAAALCLALAVSGGAADKSGVSPNSISLPKGPGSIEGLGESFQPSLNTGTAKYSVALKLPQGVAGHQRELSLNYDGGGANGPLGCGWSLELPRIRRRTDKGIPTYDENLGTPHVDTFINEDKEELVPRADGYFFCENEGAFIRYRRVGSYWEATTPEGTRLEFGRTPSARIEDTATARTFSWLLEREIDPHGNAIEYQYRAFPGEQNLNQKYLASIRYGPGAAPWSHFHFVTFVYEDRPDWFEDGRAGFLVRTGQRLRSVIVGTQGSALAGHLAGDFNADGISDYLNRRYDLSYLRYAGAQSHWSLLETVTLVGADGVTALPPTTFGYAVSNPPDEVSAQGKVWTSINEPAAVMDNELVELVDLNADGLPDILKTDASGGAHTVAVNRGPVQLNGASAVQWATPVDVDPGTGAAWTFELSSDHTHLADMNGDGLADLVHKGADDSVFYFANRGKLGWGVRQDLDLDGVAPPAPFGVSGVKTADVDFDKRMDIIQSISMGGAPAYRIWFNIGGQAYSAPATVEAIAGFDLALAGVDLIDCNGDRVPDVARIRPNAVSIAAGLGYGRFAAMRDMSLPDFTFDDAQVARAKLTDLNGDGLADLVLERASPGTCWYWLNLGNYTFSTRKVLTDLPSTVSPQAAIRWADLNGNGSTDLIYADSQGNPRLQMIDIGELVSGGINPNLLTRIDNGIGRITEVEYAASTRFALTDEAAGRPWADSVPFPVTVVAAVTVGDSLGHQYRTRFHYHDGYYDYAEKQFRGFGEVEMLEIGEASAPTLVSRSTFDTGRTFHAMKGRLLRTSTETEDGRVFENEITRWADPPRLLMTGTNGVEVRFAHPVTSVKEVLELNQGTPRQVESEFAYDDFGNQILQADFGVVEDGNRSAFDDERITLTEYATNLVAWNLRRPTRQLIQDEHGAVLSRSEFFYDDESFSGNNFGRVTTGNLTLRRDWIQASNATAFVQATRTRYDAFGNAMAILDPLAVAPGGAIDYSRGHLREFTIDPEFHTVPIAEIVHVGGGSEPLIYRASYDHGFGVITGTLDYNTNAATFGYDAFARLVRLLKPLDSATWPTAEYSYVLRQPAPYWNGSGILCTGTVNYIESRQLDRPGDSPGSARDHYLLSRQYVDGLGRTLMNRQEAEPAPGQTTPRVAVTGAMLFNARQKTARALNPFFTRRSGSLDEQLNFENIEAPGWEGQFEQNGQLVNLNLGSVHQTLTRYDATLRVVQITNPDGTSTRSEFEPFVTKNFDENDTDAASPHRGTPTIHLTDGLGRLVQVDEIVRLADDGLPSSTLRSWTTRYAYDLNDCLTRIMDAQGNVKELRYDGLKRCVFRDDPDCGHSSEVYDAASNPVESVDARGQRVTRTYDGVNRLLTEDYHDENAEFSYRRSPDVVYRYDSPAGLVDGGDGSRTWPRFVRGTLASVSDPSGEEHFSYDQRGRVEWMVKRIPDPFLQASRLAAAPLVSYRTGFQYDSMDRVVRLTYPDNDQVSQSYNARGLLERIVGGPNGNVISGMAYGPSGQQTRIDYGNGVRTDYAHDARLRTSRLSTRHATRGIELIDFGYEFDGISNVRGIQDQRSTAALAGDDRRRNSETFRYDDLSRLARVQFNAANDSGYDGAIQYRYDRIGNLLAQTSDFNAMDNGIPVANLGELSYGGTLGPSNRHGRLSAEPPGPHALTSVRRELAVAPETRSFDYDANGNMTTIDGLRCTWDFRNHLVAVESDALRAEYTYDYTGRRITKKIFSKLTGTGGGVSATVFVTEHFEVRDGEQPTKFVFNGGTRVARIVGSLSTNPRVQRIRLRTGPNLIALAVTASDLLGQLQANSAGAGSVVSKVSLWNQATGTYEPLAAGATVPAGAVLWIHAETNAVMGVVGAYADPVPRVFVSGGDYVTGSGLEAWAPTIPAPLGIWSYAASEHRWQAQLPDSLRPVSDLPALFSPGQVLFVRAEENGELGRPDPAMRIRYYHQDHLGSSSVMTDGNGTLIEETAFFPSGVPRHEYRVGDFHEEYGFTQKERDAESGLHYFDARYLSAALGRFAATDPKYSTPDGLSPEDRTKFLAQPQLHNLYAYALNNPIRYNDPTGLDGNDKVTWGSDAVGVVAGAADEVDTWTHALPPGLGTAGKVAGKTTAVISVAYRTAQFINDPSQSTGAQLANESAKTLLSISIPPVGLLWSALDLSGYGPSALIEATDKSIKAHREAKAAYEVTAQAMRFKADYINSHAPGISAKHAEIQKKIQYLNKGVAKLNQTKDQLLADQIKQAEADLRKSQQILQYYKAKERAAIKARREMSLKQE